MVNTQTIDDDAYNLRRFVDAQATTFAQAVLELAAGHKRSHWMWFIFPQIRGLGSSPMAQRFAISNLKEATAYLAHPLLGPRLRQCATLVNAVEGRSISPIFEYPDDLKFYSSVTLFSLVVQDVYAVADSQGHLFSDALEKYFNGIPDRATLAMVIQYE